MRFVLIITSSLVLCIGLISFSLKAQEARRACAQARSMSDDFYAIMSEPKYRPTDVSHLEAAVAKLEQATKIVCAGRAPKPVTSFLSSLQDQIETVKARYFF